MPPNKLSPMSATLLAVTSRFNWLLRSASMA